MKSYIKYPTEKEMIEKKFPFIRVHRLGKHDKIINARLYGIQTAINTLKRARDTTTNSSNRYKIIVRINQLEMLKERIIRQEGYPYKEQSLSGIYYMMHPRKHKPERVKISGSEFII